MSTSECTGQPLPPVPRGVVPHYCGQISVHGGPKRAVFAVLTCDDHADPAWVTNWGKDLHHVGGLP